MLADTYPEWWPAGRPYIIADCIQAMKAIPKQSVDLVLTDPPYGVGEEYIEYKDTRTHLKNIIPQFMPEIRRIAKVVLITCGYNNMWLYPAPDHVLIWDFHPGQCPGKWGYNNWQPVLAYGKDPWAKLVQEGKPVGPGGRQDLLFHRIKPGECSDVKGHPCPKPLSLWVKLIKRGTVGTGNIILDPFLGSGTTLEAARKTGNLGLGFEIDPHYEPVIARRSLITQSDVTDFGGG